MKIIKFHHTLHKHNINKIISKICNNNIPNNLNKIMKKKPCYKVKHNSIQFNLLSLEITEVKPLKLQNKHIKCNNKNKS